MKIDKGIPMPERKRYNKNADLLKSMDVGDSIDLSDLGYEGARRRYISLSNTARRHNLRLSMQDNRVWRVA